MKKYFKQGGIKKYQMSFGVIGLKGVSSFKEVGRRLVGMRSLGPFGGLKLLSLRLSKYQAVLW